MPLKITRVNIPVGTTPTKVVDADPARHRLELVNVSEPGGTTVGFGGDNTITYAVSWKRSIVLDYPSSTVEVWAIPDPADTINNNVDVLEVTISA